MFENINKSKIFVIPYAARMSGSVNSNDLISIDLLLVFMAEFFLICLGSFWFYFLDRVCLYSSG